MKDRQSELITDISLFPRCEYYSRFIGTTAFAMDNEKYWGTYHRGKSTRYSNAVGLKNTRFESDFLQKEYNAHAFHAHTGCIESPFNHQIYQYKIKPEKIAENNDDNVRDELLIYKRKIAKIVVKSYEDAGGRNTQTIENQLRPVIYCENNYPCVLVKLPILNPNECKTEAANYWAHHPKPFQLLLIASYIAILNIKAIENNIPIEIVHRASFGHNLPSICQTDITFRINVGLIPNVYAKLMGEAVHELNLMFAKIKDESSLKISFVDKKFLSMINQYNAKKLKKIIDDHKQYKELKSEKAYKNAETSSKSFDKLLMLKQKLEQDKKRKKGKILRVNFSPVEFKNEESIWVQIRKPGNSRGDSLLSECFRENITVDWFANAMMQAFVNRHPNPVESVLDKLIGCLRYEDKVTMNYDLIKAEFLKPKKEFQSLSFSELYHNDPDFSRITTMLCNAFEIEKPEKKLYEYLERNGVDFFTTYKGSDNESAMYDNGSESELSEDCATNISNPDNLENIKQFHLSGKVLRVCAGMKAIVLAHYGALAYLRMKHVRKYSLDIDQMYYETECALKSVKNDDKIRQIHDMIRNCHQPVEGILHFDLNHCNASNSALNQTFEEKLETTKPMVAILDYTNGIGDEMKLALAQYFTSRGFGLVMMVESSLKNSQGGVDFNPYGEVIVFANDNETRNEIFNIMKSGLSEKDKLSPQANGMASACKKRRLSVSINTLFESSHRPNKKIKPIEVIQDSLSAHYECKLSLNFLRYSCFAVHPNGNIIISGVNTKNDIELIVLHKETGQRLKEYGEKHKHIDFIGILPNNNILSAYSDGTLTEWDEKTGLFIKTTSVTEDIKCLSILPNSNLIIAKKNKLLELQFSRRNNIKKFNYDLGSDDINSMIIKVNGNIITASSYDDAGVIEEWNDTADDCINKIDIGNVVVNCMVMYRNNNILIGCNDNTIMQWCLSTKKHIRTFSGHVDEVTSLALRTNGNILSGSLDGTIREWDKKSGKCIQIIKGHDSGITQIAVHQNNNLLSMDNEGSLKIWNLNKAPELKLYQQSFFNRTLTSLQDNLTEGILRGDLEYVKKLVCAGISLEEKNKYNVYPLQAAIYCVNIPAIRYIESRLSKEALLKQWLEVDTNQAKSNIHEVMKSLSGLDKFEDDCGVGRWYIIDNWSHIEFYDECIKWDLDIDRMRNEMPEGFDKDIFCYYDGYYNSGDDFSVHECVIKTIREHLTKLKDSITTIKNVNNMQRRDVSVK